MARKKSLQDQPTVSKRSRLKAPVYLLLAALLFGMFYGRNLSGDVWWHLKTGQWIVQNRALPFVDPFSYTARSPMILHEWGAEVVEWLAYRLSPSALAAMSVLLISAAFVLAFRNALSRSGRVLSSFLVVAAGASAAAGSSEMRPQVFSFVFLALTVLVLQQYHERGGRILWLLAPLMVVWVNLHSVFLVGLALIALEALLAALAPPKWALGRPFPRFAAAGPLVAVAVVSGLLALVNPNGAGPFVYPFHVMHDPQATRLTNEWTSPNYHEWTGRSLLVLMGLAAIGLASLPGRPALRDFAYVAVFAVASLLSRRNSTLFAIACAGPIALWLASAESAVRSWLSLRSLERAADRAVWGILAALVALLFLWRVSDAQGRRPFDYMNMSEVFPAQACDFIAASHLSGPMFNEYNHGGYLIWRLYPQHRVFVDSRQEPFLGGAFEEWMYASNSAGPGVWQEVFDRRKINFAVLSPASALVSVLAERRDWVCVYQDDKAVIFVRNIPANAAVIRAAGR